MTPKLLQHLGSRERNGEKQKYGLFQCPICNGHFEARVFDIASGRKRNCGCTTAYKEENLPNEINGYKIIKDLRSINGRRSAIIQCPYCPTTYQAIISDVKSNRHKKHCGCQSVKIKKAIAISVKREIIKPPSAKAHPLYHTWRSMRQRCLRPSHPKYKDYGGRGISICAEWNSFFKFVEDMGPKPSPHHSIDRKDNNGNYEASNCRWATVSEQNSNRRPKKVCETIKGIRITI